MARLRVLAAALLCATGPAASAGASEDPGSAATSEPPRPACVEDLARRVQRRYEAMQSLTARFEQTTRVASLGSASSAADASQGVVTLAKPGKMRWAYEEPEPSLVVSDGETLWTYDPELNEVQRFPVTDGLLEGAAVQFLIGRGDILREFEVSGGPCEESPARLTLVPREPASYSQLELRVDASNGEIVESSIVDLFGNVTRVRFREIRIDLDIPPETFRFTPPPGARVLEAGPEER
ncbi:MAG: outer membrane lipoprotein carrier protein LolA [Deltaproteobacteria bacterium]|nr:MAG: outer membrane lipoprotein carrier protein LolA [Deltaproteobacteria bacterium]